LWQLATGQLETFSEAEVDAYLAAPTHLAFWRAHRGVAASARAATAGISEAELAALEAGTAVADTATLAKLAAQLRTEVEDLLPRAYPRAEGAEAAE
jgi:DNA-binding Xre family transcriptional regulator